MKKVILLITIIFIIGWYSHSVVSSLTTTDLIENENIGTIMNLFKPIPENNLQKTFFDSLFLDTAPERASPKDRIKESQIHVLNNRVIIDLENAEWATFTDTNSMDPIFDQGSNAIEIVPQKEEDLQVGDIISYESEFAEGTIVHRITELGNDGSWYARVKGDNIDFEDPGKIRFNQIQRVVVAIIY